MADDASTRVRVLNYLSFLDNENIKYKVISYKHWRRNNIWNKLVNFYKKKTISIRVIISTLISNPKTVYIQKIRLKPRVIKFLNKRKIKTIFDVDDAIFLKPNQDIDTQYVKYINSFNSIIGCSTFYNKYFSHCNYIPSCVKKVLTFDKEYENIKMCWIGSPWTQKYLLSIKDQIFRLLNEYPTLSLSIVGSDNLTEFKHERVNFHKWSLEKELKVLHESHIGIMPLHQDNWTKYKCSYKLLLYMIHDLVAVGTDYGLNKKVLTHGITGILVKKIDEWYSELSKLISDKTKLMPLATNGKSHAEKNYTYESNYDKWRTIVLKN